MGEGEPVNIYQSPPPRPLPALPVGLVRRRPRAYDEWRFLREWKAIPAWEPDPPGYLLRIARESCGLTQRELGERLGISQQAVARAERWDSNPTAELLRRWTEGTGVRVEICLNLR